jgi:glucose/arabinose dehydrogenase
VLDLRIPRIHVEERPGGTSRGRPVGPFVARDGTLYLTDDENGVIYRLRREASAS